MMRKKRVILSGKGGSGKDHLKDIMVQQGLTYAVSHTTRPARNGEINGEDYYFVEESEFDSMESNSQFYETALFNGWKYGTSVSEFQSKTIFIMTPSGISSLSEEDRLESVVIYIDIPEEIRRERLLRRKDADDVDRRILADEVDFSEFSDYDFVLESPNFKEDDYWDLLQIKR
jgi:guanylate kinase